MLNLTSLPSYALAEIAAYALAVARVAGFVLVSPFPGQNAPTQAKIGLVLVMAYIARAAVVEPPNFTLDLALLELVFSEVGIGLLIGFTVRVTFSASEVLGASFAQATGLTMGQVYDPALGSEDPVISRIVSLFAMLLFFALGSHRVAIGYTLESFRALPIGHAAEIGAAAPTFVGWVAQAMDAGVRLSLPVLAVGIAVQVTLALVARASPSLQVFSVGMGITVAAGMLAIMGTLEDASAGIGGELQQEGARIEHVLSVGTGLPK